jgi:hypothetical protein
MDDQRTDAEKEQLLREALTHEDDELMTRVAEEMVEAITRRSDIRQDTRE